MAERILFISGDAAWSESLAIATGHEADAKQADKQWREMARTFQPTVAVLNAANPATGIDQDARRAYAKTVVTGLWEDSPGLAVILVTSVPSERLADLGESEHIDVLLDLEADPYKLKDRILASAAQLRSSPETSASPERGIIEVTLGEAHIECEIQLGNKVQQFGPLPWDRRDLVQLNEDFRRYESDDELFGKKVDRDLIQNVAERLFWHAFETPLAKAKEFCESVLTQNDGVRFYYRFNVRDGDLEFVPFELVATANKGEYLRAAWPVARRLTVNDVHVSPDRALGKRRRNGPLKVLFILADVQGSLSIENHKFKGMKVISLAKLKHIREELEQTTALYGKDNIRAAILETGFDNFLLLKEAFEENHYDVVHFAGHSIRSETTNDVFLVIPGEQPLTVSSYNAGDFAQRASETGARLVILSSCEGASCRALSRLAAFGIPAVAGFRWKVDDRDAALFMPALHKALRSGPRPVPIVQAFHEALRAVREPSKERLTWFSPVLMLQTTSWPDYRVELET